MRPVRVIHLDSLKYNYLNIVTTEVSMVVRVLMPIMTSDHRELTDSELLLTDSTLLWSLINLNNNQLFQVVGEAHFDLRNSLHKRWFRSNANICFVANNAFQKGQISIVPNHMQTFNTYEHTPDWASREGVEVLAQLYVWSDTDKVNECSCSFAVDNKGALWTNIDPERMSHIDTEWMQRPDRSDFLTLQHKLSYEKVENEGIEFQLTCFNLADIVDVTGVYLVGCTAGYIPVREVWVEHGIGKFVWYPMMLKSGDPVNIIIKDIQGKPVTGCRLKVK